MAAVWGQVVAAASRWAESRASRAGDVQLTLYRDANGWCPHCHKVFWFLEQKRLRYSTERVHLQGDPREPPKPDGFRREVNPSGGVPVLRIGTELVAESAEILKRVDRQFPDEHVLAVSPHDGWADQIVRWSELYDCDLDDWLQNLAPEREPELRAQVERKLGWLEEQLAVHRGPFFLGARPSLLDAMYVGFLSRAATNYRYFKQLDLHDREGVWPHLAGWLQAMADTPGGQRTWQPVSNDQRVYQSHPARRAAAEPCQQLHPTRLGVGESPDWARQLSRVRPLPPGSAPLDPASPAAQEAALVIAERRGPIASFLVRKRGEAAAGEAYWRGRRHPRAGGEHWELLAGEGWRWTGEHPPPYGRPDQQHRWPAVGLSETEAVKQAADLEDELAWLAATLVGLCTPLAAAERVEATGAVGMVVDQLGEDGAFVAGELLLAPSFMSAAAEAQVEAALQAIKQAAAL